ncbi:MAG: hypothetical protein ACRCWQ_06830 [Bacilli bacterium]
MKLYGIKINGMYLEKIKISKESNEVVIAATAKMADAYTSESKDEMLKIAVLLIEELPEQEIEMFVLKIKENILEV